MKNLFFIVCCVFCQVSFSQEAIIQKYYLSEDDWFTEMEGKLTDLDRKTIKKYKNEKYNDFQRKLALFTETSTVVMESAVNNFLYKDVDKEINKINLLKDEKNTVLQYEYRMEFKREKDDFNAVFHFETKDKIEIEALKRDKMALKEFNKNLLNSYYCNIEPFKLWLYSGRDIKTRTVFNKKTLNVTYENLTFKEVCDSL